MTAQKLVLLVEEALTAAAGGTPTMCTPAERKLLVETVRRAAGSVADPTQRIIARRLDALMQECVRHAALSGAMGGWSMEP